MTEFPKTPDEWRRYFFRSGHGYLSTADGQGNVDAAPYARPHIQEDGTWAFGMTSSRTLDNVKTNPRAMYLFEEGNYRGLRVYLERVRIDHTGPVLGEIRRSADIVVGPGVGFSVTAAVYFKVTAVRPLVGG